MIFERFVFRIVYYSAIFLLRLISLLSTQTYMKYYIILLKKSGMRIVGAPRYISPDVYFDSLHRITINERCVISKKVVFLTHDYSITTGLCSINECPKSDLQINGTIILEENVFIGLGTIILPKTHVGANSIIGAGSVIKGNIPPRSVVIGNPAKVICNIDEFTKRMKINLEGLDHCYD